MQMWMNNLIFIWLSAFDSFNIFIEAIWCLGSVEMCRLYRDQNFRMSVIIVETLMNGCY